MYYGGLSSKRYEMSRSNIVRSLCALRSGLESDVPAKRPDSLLLATWNIREFGGKKQGGRRDEAIYCIAEMLDHFDIISVQELRPDLAEFERVKDLLGPHWDAIYSDVSYAKGGNSERMAYLWDTRKVRFTGLAGELVLGNTKSREMAQIARTPFICSFQSGWARFCLCSVHMYYGDGKAEEPRRVAEIDEMTQLLKGKAEHYIQLGRNYKSYSPDNLIILGDFNIFKRDDATFDAMTKNGFVVPDSLMKIKLGSNVKQDKFYDQIAFYKKVRDLSNTSSGIFDFFKYIYNDTAAPRHMADEDIPTVRKFNNWRTYQLSDHLIMWSEFHVDKSDEYLRQL